MIFRGGRKIERNEPTWRDHISEPITMRKGLTGAKPPAFCRWVLQGLGYRLGDVLDDLFPGTGVMGEVLAVEAGEPPQGGLFEITSSP